MFSLHFLFNRFSSTVSPNPMQQNLCFPNCQISVGIFWFWVREATKWSQYRLFPSCLVLFILDRSLSNNFLALITLLSLLLAGWRGGAPVCGHHPEGASQVLPGRRGTRKPSVLPGTYIWSKGEEWHTAVLTFNVQVDMMKKWQVSCSLARDEQL